MNDFSKTPDSNYEFRNVLRGGMGDSASSEINCPQQCEGCPVVAGIQQRIAAAAVYSHDLASFVMSNDEAPIELQGLVSCVTGLSIDEVREGFRQGAVEARKDVADSLAAIDDMVLEGQQVVDSLTQSCDGTIILNGENGSQRVQALTCGSPSIIEGGGMALGEEHLFVVRTPRYRLRDVIRKLLGKEEL